MSKSAMKTAFRQRMLMQVLRLWHDPWLRAIAYLIFLCLGIMLVQHQLYHGKWA